MNENKDHVFSVTYRACKPIDIGDVYYRVECAGTRRFAETCLVCDGKGSDFDCIIEDITTDRIILNVMGETASESEPDISLSLCTCLLKGDKFEQVVKHSTELGATSIIPVVSENCVSRPDEKSLKSKVARWQKIALEAAGQSGRGVIPTVENATSLKALAKTFSDYDLVLFFYEAGGMPLGETLWDNRGFKKVAVITGPEGGFSKHEADMLIGAGAKVITLGKRILRAETAPLAAIAGIMLLTDNLE